MNKFAISGKAKLVLDIIDIAAKEEAAREIRKINELTERADIEMRRFMGMDPCPFREGAMCNVPRGTNCRDIDCQVWREEFEDLMMGE